MMTKERVFITYKHIIYVNQTFFKPQRKFFNNDTKIKNWIAFNVSWEGLE